MIPSLVYEYSHLAADGIDHHLFAELCSNAILNNSPELPTYHNTNEVDCKECLSKYISSIIYRSNYSVNVAIGALIFVKRFQEAIELRQAECGEEVADAGRLFFISYMIAAKVLYDWQPRMRFWTELANDQYSRQGLARLEIQFYDMVGWKVHIDGPTFNHCFVGMMDAYHYYLERHALPSAPPPVYQNVPKHETVRIPIADVVYQLASRGSISDHDEEDKAPFVLPLQAHKILQSGWQLWGLIFPLPQVV
ncbi:hypothetical protein CPB84DRAFT_1758838 [Gymnopilus junonius]|uniref:Cyclin N-terminal domain-containing protein n=1 Tax=Gymnopilus junonius TaxID=109634 RepID=A0A9P5P536_GYMJU|nr:hypothetical protein CPB84DRAFT_1758838 [Gymnopilus junonius]